MSTAVSEIVVQAFREGNYTAVGEETTAEEMQEAIPRLRNYISALLGIEVGEPLRDFYVPHAWDPAAPLRYPLTPTGTGATSAEPWAYPHANARLLVKVDAVRTLYFPAYPHDGARMAYVDVGSTAAVTLNGNGRLIEGQASISGDPAAGEIPADLDGRTWLYRADLGNWILLGILVAIDEVPLPVEFDDLLVTGLCMRLAPRFGQQPDATIVARNQDMVSRLAKRYKQSESMPTSSELRSIIREI